MRPKIHNTKNKIITGIQPPRTISYCQPTLDQSSHASVWRDGRGGANGHHWRRRNAESSGPQARLAKPSTDTRCEFNVAVSDLLPTE